jgi:hypothetical protein
MRLARILLRYAWASPATLVGLTLAGIAGAFGATARVRKGVVEVAGGRLAGLAGSSGPRRLIAITFGHIVLGVTHGALERERAHEHAHVRQYERWGVLFFPLYAASSCYEFLRGGDSYRDNAFERQARTAVLKSAASRRTGDVHV